MAATSGRQRMRIARCLQGWLFAGISLLAPSGLSTVTAEPHSGAVPAWGEQVLHSFCSQSNCADGAGPSAGLIMDGTGNLYGTTYYGGSHGLGTVFKLGPSGSGWTHTVLYSFCLQTNCTDGYYPGA